MSEFFRYIKHSKLRVLLSSSLPLLALVDNPSLILDILNI